MTAILSIFLQVRYRRGAGLRRAGGFTFVEVVMVLVLLGILAAVAVPKYFDIQEQAAATKCAYHRSLVIKTLHQRWAFTKIDESFRSVFLLVRDCRSGISFPTVKRGTALPILFLLRASVRGASVS